MISEVRIVPLSTRMESPSDKSSPFSSRRVIFPSLHEQTEGRRAQKRRKLHEQFSSPPSLTKSPSDESIKEPSHPKQSYEKSKVVESLVALPPLHPRPRKLKNKSVTTSMVRSPTTNTRPYAMQTTGLKVREIPPFKGRATSSLPSKPELLTTAMDSLPRKTLIRSHTHPMQAARRRLDALPALPRPQSILRSPKTRPTADPTMSPPNVGKLEPAVKVDSIPSLIGLNKEDEDSQTSEDTAATPTTQGNHASPSRQNSASGNSSPGSIAFDPRVWVVEFERSQEETDTTWFTPEEMEQFKRQALARVLAYHQEMMPTGTGRLVQRADKPKAVFALKALTLDGEDEDDCQLKTTAKAEVQSILVVDPTDMCLTLFGKSFKLLFPHVKVTTAHTAEEAMKLVSGVPGNRFDIIVVEERLGVTSGSSLIRALSTDMNVPDKKEERLLIATSAFLNQDQFRMEKSGADLIWPKPPPKMDDSLRNKLLEQLLRKRSKRSTASKLFGT